MQPSSCINCYGFPCADVRHDCFVVPDVDLDAEHVAIAMIAEAAPQQRSDYFYAGANALFAQTTVLAFQDAGAPVVSLADIRARGVYLTTAIKCGKTGYGIAPATVDACSLLLEQELALFPNLRALLLMGDVAIRALNTIAKRSGEKRVISAGSTYKLRGPAYSWRGVCVFPSYLQAGPSFFIEKSKRKMIAEDIAAALQLTG